ncbi:ABC transporter ATP-binding protein, partial [Streptomyces minutiscleroticus]
WRLMDGRTALVVAHRLSTVAGMDRLVVLDQGNVVEQGTHGELLAAGGAYAKLWRHQSGGFLGESAEPASDDALPGAGPAGLPGPVATVPGRG